MTPTTRSGSSPRSATAAPRPRPTSTTRRATSSPRPSRTAAPPPPPPTATPGACCKPPRPAGRPAPTTTTRSAGSTPSPPPPAPPRHPAPTTPSTTYGYRAYGSPATAMFTGADAGNTSPGPTVVPYNSYRFNAMPWDPGSGQYNMGFRNYQPGLGSFTTRDMYAGAGADMAMTGNPFSRGAYTFGDASPISDIEMDGHCWSGFGAVCSAFDTATNVVYTGYHDLTSAVSSGYQDLTSAVSSGYQDLTSAFASGYHDFLSAARSTGHVIAAGAKVVGHGLVKAAKVVGSATGITDAINCVRNPTLMGCLTAVGKLPLTASALADGGASLGRAAAL